MKREEQLSALEAHKGKKWDVVVIGGGATGFGIALDATARGYKTLLLERSDFGQGTSSRSTKLVHGGVRYLAQGDLLLVIEALKERGRMLKNAPHLTKNQEFIIPAYSWFDVILYITGLKFYDILAGRLSLGKSYFIGKNKTLERLPNIKEKGLKGGIVYHDGQFDDSRMVIALAKECTGMGCTALNYFNVLGLSGIPGGKTDGVMAEDIVSGKQYEIKSSLVINATGVFADGILSMDNPGSVHIIKPSQGIHLVLDKSFLESESAIMIPRTDDGRVLFAIPWLGKVVAGTTDTPLDIIKEEPEALEKEIEFILDTAGRYFKKAPARKDVLSVFAGLRPLASDPGNPESTKEISRRHKILLSSSGLLTITGGKWTTYRRMAEETLDKAIKAGLIPARKCITADMRIQVDNDFHPGKKFMSYGSDSGIIEKLVSENTKLGRRISDSFPYTMAEIVWSCRTEMPVALADMMARRTRMLLLDAGKSKEAAPVVASIMAQEMGHDQSWQMDQLEKYGKLVRNYTC
jgi:glycerol-3-phosphate dehydrogenase